MKYFFVCSLFLVNSLTIGQTSTNLNIHDRSGDVVSFDDLTQNGHPKILLFWSSYCKMCKLEMKGICNIGQNWWEEYGAEVIFVSLENYLSKAYNKIEFINDYDSTGFYFLFDNNMHVYNSFGGDAIPFTVLLNDKGDVIRTWNGYDDGLERSIGLYFRKLSNASVQPN